MKTAVEWLEDNVGRLAAVWELELQMFNT